MRIANTSISLHFILAISLLLTCACGQKELSKNYPFAVEAGKYRSWHKAHQVARRIQADGLAVSVVCTETERTGKWYRLVVGAKETHSEAMALKIFCEDQYGFNQVNPITIADVDSISCKGKSLNTEGTSSRIVTQQPHLSEHLIGLLSRLPHMPDYHITQMTLFNMESGTDPTRFKLAKDCLPDIPRGFIYQEIFASSGAFAEVNFRNEFRDKHLNIQLYELKDEQCVLCGKDNLPKWISERILDTREYEVEKMDSTYMVGPNSLNGYLVTITPTPRKPKYYMVFTDRQGKWLYVIQSPEEDLGGMKAVAQKMTLEKSDISLQDEFYNSFSTLPVNLARGEMLSFYKLTLIGENKERSGDRIEGCYQTDAVLNHVVKGTMYYEMINMLDERNVEVVFEDRNHLASTWIDTIPLYGHRASIQYEGRTQRFKNRPQLIRFATAEEYGQVHNYSGDKLDSLDFLIKAQTFQLGMGRKLTR